MFVFHVTLRLE